MAKSKQGQGPRPGRGRAAVIEGEGVVALFAVRLRAARLSRGMTQSDLADRAGLSAAYVGRLEGAGVAPGIDLVAKLTSALGLDVAALLGGPPVDPLPVYRAQAEALMATLLKAGRLETYLFLNPLLAGLVESLTRGVGQEFKE